VAGVASGFQKQCISPGSAAAYFAATLLVVLAEFVRDDLLRLVADQLAVRNG
jgi:hypothetical protein